MPCFGLFRFVLFCFVLLRLFVGLCRVGLLLSVVFRSNFCNTRRVELCNKVLLCQSVELAGRACAVAVVLFICLFLLCWVVVVLSTSLRMPRYVRRVTHYGETVVTVVLLSCPCLFVGFLLCFLLLFFFLFCLFGVCMLLLLFCCCCFFWGGLFDCLFYLLVVSFVCLFICSLAC